eukprot:EG_transcript_11908
MLGCRGPLLPATSRAALWRWWADARGLHGTAVLHGGPPDSEGQRRARQGVAPVPSPKPRSLQRKKNVALGDPAARYVKRMEAAALPLSPDTDVDFQRGWGPARGETPGPQRAKLSVYLARCGVCPRARAAELIQKGLVQVDGRIVDLNCELSPGDRVTVGGQPVTLPEPRIWLYNKPQSEVDILQPGVNVMDPAQRPQYVRAQRDAGLPDHAVAISGLSIVNEGLQVFTNDSHLAQQISLSRIRQVYIVHIRGQIPPHLLESIRRGADLDGVHHPGLDVKVNHESPRRSALEITVDSNKRQKGVRLLLKAVHCQVWMVRRVQYGPFFLKGIPEGQAREVSVPAAWQKFLNPTWRSFAAGQYVPARVAQRRAKKPGRALEADSDEGDRRFLA